MDLFTDNRDVVYGQKGRLKDNKDGFTEKRFVMHLAWLLLIYTFCNSICIHQFLEVYSLHCTCLRIYFVGIQI